MRLSALLVFSISVAAALIHHFAFAHARLTLAFDARQYLFNTATIAEILLSILRGHSPAALAFDPKFVYCITIDGPVVPFFFGVLFAAAGHVPTTTDWKALEILQSIVHGLSACLVLGLVWRLTRLRAAALGAALSWGLYPPAIIWSGIFYSETLAVFLSLLFAFSLSMSAERRAMRPVAGVSAALCFLLKPALAVPVGAAIVLACAVMPGVRRKRLTVVATIVLCAVATTLPWAVYTKMATGKVLLSANRMPSANLATGMDTEVDGGQVSPPQPLTAMFMDDPTPMAFPLAQFEYRTRDTLRLMAEKVTFLFGRPSNDYRQRYFGIDAVAQTYLHIALLALGLVGLFRLLLGGLKTLDGQRRLPAVISICFIVGHLPYLLFTTSSRYGLTAFPFFVVLAGYAAAQTLSIRGAARPFARRLAAAWALGLLLTAGISAADTLARLKEPQEVAHVLGSGDAAVKVIDLSGTRPPAAVAGVVLLVDGDAGLDGDAVEVNGHRLAGLLEHVRYFDSPVYEHAYMLREVGYPMGLKLRDFRQWRAIRLPAEIIDWRGRNTVRVIQATGRGTIYGDMPAGARKMKAIEPYCSNYLGNYPESTDYRIWSPVLSARVGQSSAIEGNGRGAGAPGDHLSDSLRVKLAVVTGSPGPDPGLKQPTPSRTVAVGPADFDPLMRAPQSQSIFTNRHILKGCKSPTATIALPEVGNGTHLNLKVEGEIRAMKNGSRVGILVALPGSWGPPVVVATMPAYISADKHWTRFTIADLVPEVRLAPGRKTLYLGVYPGPWLDIAGYGSAHGAAEAELRNITVEVSSVSKPDLSGRRVIYY